MKDSARRGARRSPTHSKATPSALAETPPRQPWYALLGAGVALLAALPWIADRLPDVPGWGAVAPRYLPPTIASAGVVLALAAVAFAAAEVLARRSAGPEQPAQVWRPSAPVDFAGAIACGLAAAILCGVFPDRAHFTGDFLLRLGMVAVQDDPHRIFAQATPLDLAAFIHLPRWLVSTFGLSPALAARALGLVLAFGFGVAGWSFARALDLPRIQTVALALLVTLQPPLALFTGYSKALVAMPVLLVAAVTAGLRALQGRRGLIALGLVTGIAIALHRSGLALVPVWALVLWLRARESWQAGVRPRASWLVAALVPAIAVALTFALTLETLRHHDAAHFASGVAAGPSGPLAWLTGRDWSERLDVALLLAPLLVLAPFVAWGARPARPRGELQVLAAALIPQLVILVAISPKQGLYRDWDVFAGAGIALTLLLVWRLAPWLGSPRRVAITAAVAFAGASPALGWLAHWSDEGLAAARLQAWLERPSARADAGAASGWSFLASRANREKRWDEAAACYERAVAAAPNPRTLVEWGISEALSGSPPRALALYTRAAALDSNLTTAWLGMAASASLVGDLAAMRRARAQLERLAPGHPQIADISAYLLHESEAAVATAAATFATLPAAPIPLPGVARGPRARLARIADLARLSDSSIAAVSDTQTRNLDERPSGGFSGP